MSTGCSKRVIQLSFSLVNLCDIVVASCIKETEKGLRRRISRDRGVRVKGFECQLRIGGVAGGRWKLREAVISFILESRRTGSVREIVTPR